MTLQLLFIPQTIRIVCYLLLEFLSLLEDEPRGRITLGRYLKLKVIRTKSVKRIGVHKHTFDSKNVSFIRSEVPLKSFETIPFRVCFRTSNNVKPTYNRDVTKLVSGEVQSCKYFCCRVLTLYLSLNSCV